MLLLPPYILHSMFGCYENGSFKSMFLNDVVSIKGHDLGILKVQSECLIYIKICEHTSFE